MKLLYFGFFAVLVSMNAWASTTVSNAWVRSAPPNARAIGVFMDITNHSMNDIKLISVSAKNYPFIELHRTQNEDGVMKMIQQEYIPISVNSTIKLKPGSWHIMLMSPMYVPKVGEHVELDLTFDDGTTKNVIAVVKKDQSPMMHHHKHHKNHTHH